MSSFTILHHKRLINYIKKPFFFFGNNIVEEKCLKQNAKLEKAKKYPIGLRKISLYLVLNTV